MPAPAYDPHAQQRQTPGMIEATWQMINPMALAKYKYFYDPRTYNLSRGVHMPFGKNLVRNITSSKRWAALARRPVRNFGTFVGGSYFMGESLLKEQATQSAARRVFQRQMRSRIYDALGGVKRPYAVGHGVAAGVDPYLYKGLGWRAKSKASRFLSKEVVNMLDDLDISKRGGPLTPKAFGNKLKGAVRKLAGTDTVKKLGLTADDVVKAIRPKGITRTVIETKSAQAFGAKAAARGLGAGAFKLGLMGMKGIAAIGSIATLWDFTQMIAQPIGRWMVNEANATLTRWEQRFMPEMGGRLAMSYMTTGAATERQRAVQAISKAYINGRSAFGGEAALMHS